MRSPRDFFLHALTEQAGQQTHRDTDQRHGDNTQHQQVGTDNGIGQTGDGDSGITGADGAAGDHGHDTGENVVILVIKAAIVKTPFDVMDQRYTR